MKHFPVTIAAAVLVLTALAPASAQDQRSEFGSIGANGLPLRALPDKVIDPPRTPDGRPDFQGYWSAWGRQGVPTHSLEEGVSPESQALQGFGAAHNAGGIGSVIVDPADGLIPYQPWAAAERKERLKYVDFPTERWQTDPDDRCFVAGIPRANMTTFSILQRPGYVIFLYGAGYRVVPLDGRPHVGKNLQLYMGDSRGRWEGNTLVIDVTNNDDVIWLDSHASFHGPDMRVTERWTLVDKNTLFYEVTINEPKVFTQPWKVAVTFDRGRDQRAGLFGEESCHEGERSVNAMVVVGRRLREKGEVAPHQHSAKDREYWINEAIRTGAPQGRQALEAQAGERKK